VASILAPLASTTYAVAVVGAAPAVALAFLLGRWLGFPRALALVLGVPLLAGTFLSLVLGGPIAAMVVAATALIVVVGPILVGVAFVSTRADTPVETVLRRVTAAWPVAMVASAVVFFAPGGAARPNVTFLDWLVALLGPGVVVAIALVGPGVLGLLLVRRGV
jgi:hypothetical protein